MPSCQSCKAPIMWKNIDGKWHPTNSDGTSHFDTCPHANKHRNKKYKNQGVDYTVDYTKPIKKNKNQRSLDEF